MITCRQFADLLVDYVDKTITETQLEIFEAHLKICPGCVHYFGSYATTIRLAKQSFDATAPAQIIPEPVVRAIVQARST